MAQQAAPRAGGGVTRQACAAGVKSPCSGIQPGGGRIMACMREHANAVSASCTEAFAERRQSRAGAQHG